MALFDDLDINDETTRPNWQNLVQNAREFLVKFGETQNVILRKIKDGELENPNGEIDQWFIGNSIAETIANEYEVDSKAVLDAYREAKEEDNRGDSSRVTDAKKGGNSKRILLEEADQAEPHAMFGELIDNIFDNFLTIIGKDGDEVITNHQFRDYLEIEIDMKTHGKGPIWNYIRIRENSGGVLDENADKLFQSQSETKHQTEHSIGVFNAGLKRALPHFGRWHTIETWTHIDDIVCHKGKVGRAWAAGSHEDAKCEDPGSTAERDYWHRDNNHWGTPEGRTVAEQGKVWVTEERGRTQITIQKLTHHAQKLLESQKELDKLIEFLRVTWSRKIRLEFVEKLEKHVIIRIKHPLMNFNEVVISSMDEEDYIGLEKPEYEDLLNFIDFTSKEFISENFMELEGVSPRVWQGILDVPVQYDDSKIDKLSVTLITGIPNVWSQAPAEGERLDFTTWPQDPYPGFYWWGNGRLFHRAWQPNIDGYKKPVSTYPKSRKQLTLKKMRFGKGQQGYFVSYICIEGNARSIPFSGPIKWSVNPNHPIVKICVEASIAMGGAGTHILNQVQAMGATEKFKQALISNLQEEVSSPSEMDSQEITSETDGDDEND